MDVARGPRPLRAVPPAISTPTLAGTWPRTPDVSRLRLYTVDPTRDGVDGFAGGINELHQRFREKEVELFEKHGAEIIAVWQDLGEPRRLIWMLAYRDRAHRDEVFAAFAADPAWSELRQRLNVPIERPTTFMMSATDYSPLK